MDGKTPYEIPLGPNERVMCVPVCDGHVAYGDKLMPVNRQWVIDTFGYCSKDGCGYKARNLAVTVVEAVPSKKKGKA